MDLKKSPSVSETIDWAKALVLLNAKSLDKETLDNTLTILLKHEADVQRARATIQRDEGQQRRNRGGEDPFDGNVRPLKRI
jgi:hypothetical protein